MPPITDPMVLDATNRALSDLDPPGSIPSLDSDKKSDPNGSCNNFAPAVLEYVEQASGGSMKTTEYGTDASKWPSSFPDQSFVNFSLQFEKSSANHNFNVYFKSGGTGYRLQVYLGHSIRISTPQSSASFIAQWKNLTTAGWADAYEALFYVRPDTADNAFVSQYVTVLTAS